MIKTIVIEDEVLIRIALKAKLEEAGCKIIGESGEGNESIQIIKDNPPDLLLLDVKLRGEMTGIDIFNEINKDHAIPTVFISAYDFDDYKDQISGDNIIAAFDKPLSDVDVANIVEKYKQYISKV